MELISKEQRTYSYRHVSHANDCRRRVVPGVKSESGRYEGRGKVLEEISLANLTLNVARFCANFID